MKSLTDRIIEVVRHDPYISATRVARFLQEKPGTVSGIMHRLVYNDRLARTQQEGSKTWVYWVTRG